jgi:hypothetical protein
VEKVLWQNNDGMIIREALVIFGVVGGGVEQAVEAVQRCHGDDGTGDDPMTELQAWDARSKEEPNADSDGTQEGGDQTEPKGQNQKRQHYSYYFLSCRTIYSQVCFLKKTLVPFSQMVNIKRNGMVREGGGGEAGCFCWTAVWDAVGSDSGALTDFIGVFQLQGAWHGIGSLRVYADVGQSRNLK